MISFERCINLASVKQNSDSSRPDPRCFLNKLNECWRVFAMKILFPVVAMVLLCGCAAGVSRYGYSVEPSIHSAVPDIAIKKDAHFEKEDVDVLGRIKVYDKFFSTKCDEATVFDIVLGDAGALGADLVNILWDKQPGYVWTVCYRMEAEFLRFHDREMAENIHSDPKYELACIQRRGEVGRQRKDKAYALAVVGGATGPVGAGIAGSAMASEARGEVICP
jgi:hypothetical protein